MDAHVSTANEVGSRPFNNLLRRLSVADYALIAPYLATEEAAANELLYNPGDDVQVVVGELAPLLLDLALQLLPAPFDAILVHAAVPWLAMSVR